MSQDRAAAAIVSVSVVVPWFDNGNPHRRAAFDRVVKHLADGDYRVIVCNPFPIFPGQSPGNVRNLGADRAIRTGANLIVFNDADSIVSYRQLDELVTQAWEQPGLVFGYSVYHRLDREMRTEREIFNSGSMGCVAIRSDCWRQVGGFDTLFQGWGYEDLEFANRCAGLWPLRRVEGPLYHLWHGERNTDDSPDDSQPDLVAANLERWRDLQAGVAV